METFSQPILQLQNEGVELRNGTRVLKGGFAAMKHLTKFSQLISLNFAQLSSNGHNFFVSTPIHVPFEVLITTKKCYFVDLIIMVLSTFE